MLDDVKWGLHEVLVMSYHALNGKFKKEIAQICWRMVFFDEVGKNLLRMLCVQLTFSTTFGLEYACYWRNEQH